MAAAVLGGATVIGLAGRDDTPHNRLFDSNPALATLMAIHGKGYGLTRQTCGFTLSLDRAYADANRVVVAFTLSGPTNRTFIALQSFGVQLSTARGGVRLRDLGASDISSMENNRSSVVVAFDTHPMGGRGGRLDLRLTVPGFTLRQKKTATEWGWQRCERITAFGEASKSDNSSLSLWDRLRRAAPGPFGDSTIGATVDVGIARPLTIPFSVPIDPAHIEVHPNQAIRAGNTTLILDRVIATQSEMRVYLRRATPGHILENAQLGMSGYGRQFWSNNALFGDWWTRIAPASRRYDFAIPGVIYGPGATYTLTVRPRAGVTSPGMPWRTLNGGPWVFHFRL